jgi:sulfate transport system substrate-binding protein
MINKTDRWFRPRLCLALGLPLLGLAAGCSRAAERGSDTLTIGAYSVLREVLHEGVLPRFATVWKQKTGRAVRFEESYNASGAQSRAIASGFDADVALLSLEGDVERLVKEGLVRDDWKSGPAGGMVTRSLVVIGHREGNPHQIQDWDDLAKPGVGVLYPDPKTSGGARWNINAIYGAGLLNSGGDRDAARDLLARIQANVVNMDGSGRQSVATFERGVGDVVVTYENELLLQTKMTGMAAPYVIPPATLLIEGPGAIVDASVDRHGNRALAEAFLDFVRSPEGQRIMADYGFRPLDQSIATDPTRQPLPPRLFTMTDLGGWARITADVYESGGVWDRLFTGGRRR